MISIDLRFGSLFNQWKELNKLYCRACFFIYGTVRMCCWVARRLAHPHPLLLGSCDASLTLPCCWGCAPSAHPALKSSTTGVACCKYLPTLRRFSPSPSLTLPRFPECQLAATLVVGVRDPPTHMDLHPPSSAIRLFVRVFLLLTLRVAHNSLSHLYHPTHSRPPTLPPFPPIARLHHPCSPPRPDWCTTPLRSRRRTTMRKVKDRPSRGVWRGHGTTLGSGKG